MMKTSFSNEYCQFTMIDIITVLSEWNWIKLILCTKQPKFTMLFYYIEMPTRSCLPDMFLPLMRPFKWGTAWSSISRGIRITTSPIQKLQQRPTLWSKLRWPKTWLIVFLMSLEIELHAVPHLKDFIDVWNISG